MTTTKLTPEERKTFEAFYDRRIRESATTPDHAGELRAAKDLLRAVIDEGVTPLGDGSVSYVRRGSVDWADPVTAAAAQAASDGSGKGAGSGRKAVGRGREVFQGVAVMLAALLFVLYYWLSSGGGEPAETEVAAAVITPTLTIDIGASPTPLPTLEAEMLADIVDSSGVRTGLVVPRTLEIKGVTFVVQPVQIDSGDWTLPYEERAASWVYGTVINYVMGIAASESNKALLSALKPGDQLLLRTSTGPAYRFSYADTVWVAPHASEVFRQNRPGLTLVLLEDSGTEQRAVVRASYVPDSELGLDANYIEIKAALGETVTLDNVARVTTLNSRLLARPGAPPGYIYQAVDYQVRNIGEVELASSSFRHHLEAGGVTYPVIAVPHEDNPYPLIPEVLAPGATFTTTAVYAVPETALVTGVAWEFSPGPAGSKVRVRLPLYSGRLKAAAQVTNAWLSETDLAATIAVTAGLQNVEIRPEDIQVEGGQLSPVGNVFPWQISAGGSGEFVLLITPGGAGRVTVTLLDQGFEFEY